MCLTQIDGLVEIGRVWEGRSNPKSGELVGAADTWKRAPETVQMPEGKPFGRMGRSSGAGEDRCRAEA